MSSPELYTRANPRHRLMIELTAMGKTNEEISLATSYSIQYVQGIVRSPLFQQEVADTQAEIKAHVLRTFAERLAQETLPSLHTLVKHRDNAVKDADQITAANAIIRHATDIYIGNKKDRDERKVTRLVLEGGDLRDLIAAAQEIELHKTGLHQNAIDAQTVHVPNTPGSLRPALPSNRIRAITVNDYIKYVADVEDDIEDETEHIEQCQTL